MFIFVIDTDQYSGNFERELTAYCTGHIGECGVGDNFAKMFKEDKLSEKFNNIQQVADEGCSRPCAIYPTPGYFNNGMGVAYKESEDLNMEEIVEHWKNQHIEYKEAQRANHIRWDEEAGNSEKKYQKQLDKEIAEIKKRTLKDLCKHPSYQSVAIYFSTKPTKEQIQIMKDRSADFCFKKSYNKNNPTINIIGYRLIEEKTITTSMEIDI